MPPPRRLRARRASPITSSGPASSEPTGAHRPFDRQHMTVVTASAHSAAPMPVATSALKRRAPSMWMGTGPAASTTASQPIHRPRSARCGHVRVLDADERHLGLMVRRGLTGPPHVVGVDRPVPVVERHELHAGVQCRRAELVGDDVLAPSRHHRRARRREHAERDLVRHDARRNEQRGRLADPCRERLLQPPDRRVLPVVVVADHRVRHGAAHGRRGPGDGVAAQVDHIGHTVRLTARR